MYTYVRGYVPDDARAAIADAKPGTPIRFTASTEGVARDNLVIAQDGWDLKAYKSNPVFLWHHNYTGWGDPDSSRALGRAQTVKVENGKLVADVVFNQANDFARAVEADYRNGFMNAVSVGWDTKEFEPDSADTPWTGGKVLKAELLDISAVVVPGDPKALMERQKRALSDFGRDLLKLIEPETDPEPTKPVDPAPSARATWEDAAAAMARLFTPFAQRPDDERKADYQRLARDYARHKRTPPEFLEQKAIDALDAASVRGLFLEQEPDLIPEVFAAIETRAGAVLSRKNQADLQQAIDLIAAVLARATKEESTEDDERTADDDPFAAIAKAMGIAA